MEYRTTKPADNGYEDEAEEYEAMHQFVQGLMHKSGPEDLLDTLLVIANVSEQRALMQPELSVFYNKMHLLMRGALNMLARTKDDPRPQDKLENPMLYFPSVEKFH